MTSTTPSLVDRYVLPPDQIERLSLERVHAALDPGSWTPAEQAIAERMVYAAGDLSIAPAIRIHPLAATSGMAALRAHCTLVVDVRAVEVSLDHPRLEGLGCPITCLIDDPEVARRSSDSGLPRAVEAMRASAPHLDGAVVVIGNAPTALLALLDLIDAGTAQPVLVIGSPVGFVAATEAKAELLQRDTPFITVEGTRGGSAIAAAAANALIRLATTTPAHQPEA